MHIFPSKSSSKSNRTEGTRFFVRPNLKFWQFTISPHIRTRCGCCWEFRLSYKTEFVSSLPRWVKSLFYTTTINEMLHFFRIFLFVFCNQYFACKRHRRNELGEICSAFFKSFLEADPSTEKFGWFFENSPRVYRSISKNLKNQKVKISIQKHCHVPHANFMWHHWVPCDSTVRFQPLPTPCRTSFSDKNSLHGLNSNFAHQIWQKSAIVEHPTFQQKQVQLNRAQR